MFYIDEKYDLANFSQDEHNGNGMLFKFDFYSVISEASEKILAINH